MIRNYFKNMKILEILLLVGPSPSPPPRKEENKDALWKGP